MQKEGVWEVPEVYAKYREDATAIVRRRLA